MLASMRPVHILGISAFYHDSAASLLRDGEIVAAASEERFTRKKGDASFPAHAVAFCLRQGGITLADLDYVGFYDKPLLKFERILETYLGVVPRGFRSFLMAGPLWMKEKLYQDRMLRDMPIRQAFPSAKAESIDPFLLLHHADVKVPTHIPVSKAGVGPHPHRGFSPVSFIFKGGVHHRDSRGYDNVVYEGGTQWMNAGMGVIHSERPPADIFEKGGRQELIQLWVNTPAEIGRAHV